MKKLLIKKQFYLIDKQYKLTDEDMNDTKKTSEVLAKILARCIKMYDAVFELYKIISNIQQRNIYVTELKQEFK